MDEIDRQITIKSSCISLVHADTFLVNLIDSPGHVDFAAEVSAAARLTDGGVLVVDAVEGVRAQTCSVIKQAWENRIVPILFLNKIDKLVQLVQDPATVHSRLRQIIENVNLVFNDLLEAYREEQGLAIVPEWGDQFQFDPVRGNVLFGSALHGWAFDLETWTDKLVAPKLAKLASFTSDHLTQFMFGEYTLPGLFIKSQVGTAPIACSADFPTNLFSKCLIEPIALLYQAGTGQAKLAELFPLSKAVFEAVLAHVPAPDKAVQLRAGLLSRTPINLVSASNTLIFVVKHHPADLAIQCLLGDRVDSVRKLSGFVGISRVFSGAIRRGQSLFAISASGAPQPVQIKRIFLLMGSSLVPVDSALAGCVVGLEFVPDLFDAGGVTLSSNPDSPALISPYHSAQAIVRVTAEVKRSADEPVLDAGLQLLARSDPAVVVARHPQTGERIIGCCGDEHLARCVQDLEQLFAVGVNVLISEPLVEIRESLASVPMDEIDGEIDKLPAWLGEFAWSESRTVKCVSPDGSSTVTARADAIPPLALEWIAKWQESLRSLFHERQVPAQLWPMSGESESATLDSCIASVVSILANLGVNHVQDMHVKSEAFCALTSTLPLADAVKFGFQQTCFSGPLAEEPIRGVVFTIEELEIGSDHPSSLSYATSLACKTAMLAGPVRLAEPLLQLDLQTEHVKAAQAVLAQRRADIFYSDLVEGSYSEYLIRATLPASEAFRIGDKSKLSFSDELRGATHGKIVWRLAFSHWVLVGDSSPISLSGVAHKLVCGVRKRKGLSVGEKVVADADKQRTLTKMK